MHSLIRLAFDTLQDQSAAAAIRQVACAALLQAGDTGLELPAGAHLAVWKYLLAADTGAATLRHHALEHPEVARDAVRVLLDSDSGESAREVALSVLRGSNVEQVDEESLTTIVDRMLDESRARQAIWLLERVHEERGLRPEFLLAIRERLSRASVAAVRCCAVEIGGLLPRMDEEFVSRMFDDPAPAVRVAVTEMLQGVAQTERARAIALLRERLRLEEHRNVIAALHDALGTLIRAVSRQ